MSTPSVLNLPTACTSAAFQAPTVASFAFQTITYCSVDTFDNHTAVATSCCSSSNGTISNSTDGCNVFCEVNAPLLDTLETCFNTSSTPAFCGQTNFTGPAFPSTSTVTSTSSAAAPSKSNASRRFVQGNHVVGIIVFLMVLVMQGC
jgi:hypothetical protein